MTGYTRLIHYYSIEIINNHASCSGQAVNAIQSVSCYDKSTAEKLYSNIPSSTSDYFAEFL